MRRNISIIWRAPDIRRQVPWLDPATIAFPPVEQALLEPNGLVAGGGRLDADWLLLAYRSGIFPWFEESQPILWWAPDPRAVLFPEELKISRSLSKTLRKNRFRVKINASFEQVVEACSQPRSYSDGSWITDAMKTAYYELHQLGHAHSIECYLDGRLVGGLYGVGMGKLFFGESMFHTETDASKVAFAYLVRLLREHHCPLIDCQVPNSHLESLGAEEIPREEFMRYLTKYVDVTDPIAWAGLPIDQPPW